MASPLNFISFLVSLRDYIIAVESVSLDFGHASWSVCTSARNLRPVHC